jgi:hypothetical protein
VTRAIGTQPAELPNGALHGAREHCTNKQHATDRKLLHDYTRALELLPYVVKSALCIGVIATVSKSSTGKHLPISFSDVSSKITALSAFFHRGIPVPALMEGDSAVQDYLVAVDLRPKLSRNSA